MTDLHTHILPGMDDGARTAEESIAMLRAQSAQGVKHMALTPHFYRHRERTEDFLRRREAAWLRLQEAMDALPREEREALPELTLGAEVAWKPNTGRWEELEQLRIGANGPVLLELPFSPWGAPMLDQLYDLVCRTGCTLVLAHLDRYFKGQKKDYIRQLYSMGLVIQLDAAKLDRVLERGTLLRLLRQDRPFLLASDCHDLTSRPPCLGRAAAVMEKNLGRPLAEQVLRRSDKLFSR